MMVCMQPSPSFYNWGPIGLTAYGKPTSRLFTIFAESVVVGLLKVIQKGTVLNHKKQDRYNHFCSFPRTPVLIIPYSFCVFIVVISVSHAWYCMNVPDIGMKLNFSSEKVWVVIPLPLCLWEFDKNSYEFNLNTGDTTIKNGKAINSLWFHRAVATRAVVTRAVQWSHACLKPTCIPWWQHCMFLVELCGNKKGTHFQLYNR